MQSLFQNTVEYLRPKGQKDYKLSKRYHRTPAGLKYVRQLSRSFGCERLPNVFLMESGTRKSYRRHPVKTVLKLVK
jgi:hypothetical protein